MRVFIKFNDGYSFCEEIRYAEHNYNTIRLTGLDDKKTIITGAHNADAMIQKLADTGLLYISKEYKPSIKFESDTTYIQINNNPY